jgi:hypothetical protein
MADTPDEGTPTIVREPARRRGFFRRHWGWALPATVLLVPLALLAAWATITLAYTYSSGDRTGFNQKLSRKGWICKTWEGELAMTAAPGVAPEIFHYSVRDDSVARAIDALAGQRVKLTYEEHRGVPTSCFGETDYFATGVQRVGP